MVGQISEEKYKRRHRSIDVANVRGIGAEMTKGL